MIQLKWNRFDLGRVFAKKAWRGNGTMFSWNEEYERYCYCSIQNGAVLFKGSYHGADRPSMVGDEVLRCEMNEILYEGKEMKKEIEVTVVVEQACDKPEIKLKKVKWYGFFYDADGELCDSYFFVSKKEATKMLKKFPLGTTVELYRKEIKLSVDLPIIEEEF